MEVDRGPTDSPSTHLRTTLAPIQMTRARAAPGTFRSHDDRRGVEIQYSEDRLATVTTMTTGQYSQSSHSTWPERISRRSSGPRTTSGKTTTPTRSEATYRLKDSTRV